MPAGMAVDNHGMASALINRRPITGSILTRELCFHLGGSKGSEGREIVKFFHFLMCQTFIHISVDPSPLSIDCTNFWIFIIPIPKHMPAGLPTKMYALLGDWGNLPRLCQFLLHSSNLKSDKDDRLRSYSIHVFIFYTTGQDFGKVQQCVRETFARTASFSTGAMLAKRNHTDPPPVFGLIYNLGWVTLNSPNSHPISSLARRGVCREGRQRACRFFCRSKRVQA